MKGVRFTWMPTLCEVRWVEQPEEVPVWDWSRGPVDNPTSNQRYTHYSLLKSAVAGEHYDATAHFRKVFNDAEWLPKPAPKKGYPRLVRSKISDLGTSEEVSDHSLINDISGLVRNQLDSFDLHFGKVQLNQIASLCEKYGPIDDPKHPYSHTARRWIVEAYYTYASIEAHNLLNDIGVQALGTFLLNRQDQWVDDLAENKSGFLSLNSPWLDIENKLASWRWEKFAPEQQVIAARKRIAEQYLHKFSFGSTHLISLDDGAILYYVPITKWLALLLADLWLENRPINVCEGCGRLFVQARKDMRHCHSRCRAIKR